MPKSNRGRARYLERGLRNAVAETPRSLEMRESKSARLTRIILFGLACFIGALIGALILSVILNRETSGFELVQAVVLALRPVRATTSLHHA